MDFVSSSAVIKGHIDLFSSDCTHCNLKKSPSFVNRSRHQTMSEQTCALVHLSLLCCLCCLLRLRFFSFHSPSLGLFFREGRHPSQCLLCERVFAHCEFLLLRGFDCTAGLDLTAVSFRPCHVTRLSAVNTSCSITVGRSSADTHFIIGSVWHC